MTARGRYVFDVDTAAANANVSRLNKNTEGVGNSFVKAAAPLGRLVTLSGAAAAAGGLVLSVWSAVAEKMSEASNRLQAGVQSRTRLLSLASTPAERERLSNAVSATQAETGIDETRASNFQFQLESLGLGGNRQELARVFNLGQDAEAVATAVSRLRKVFGEEAGNVTDLVNKLFAGAASSEAGIDQFGETVAKIGSIVQATGTPLDDLIATMSQLGGKEMSELATNVKALATAATRSGSNSGLIDFVENLSGQGLNNKQLSAKLGSVEAFEAFRLIQGQLGNIPGARANLANAVSGDIVTQRLGIVGGDARVAAGLALAQQQGRTRLAEDSAYADTGAALDQYRSQIDERIASHWEAGNTFRAFRLWAYSKVASAASAASFADREDLERKMADGQEELIRNTQPKPPRYRPENQAHPDGAPGAIP